MKIDSKIVRKKLRGGTALQALALIGASAGAVTMAAAPAAAQDYTNINATGRVVGPDNEEISGATVTVRSDAQGFSRSVTTNNAGAFRVPQIPAGSYTFTVEAPGYQTYNESGVELSKSGAANQFKLVPSTSEAGEDIVVTGTRTQVVDFDNTTTGASIDVGDLQKRVPVARNLRDVILLAPGTTQGGSAQNSRFAGQATIGGSSFAENAYYVNGLNITEFRQGFSPVAIPFDFYDTVETKSGGFQAEFGRATGGVVNATTKSGSNEFHGSVLFNFEPDDLRNDVPNTYRSDNDADFEEKTEAVFQLSGPILKDHLFFYGIYSARNNKGGGGARTADDPANNRYTFTKNDSPFYGGKIDFVPFDGQRLEGTYFNSTSTNENRSYIYNSNTNRLSDFSGGSNERFGGENYVGRYTGSFTDWLTVSAAYGVNKNRSGILPLDTENPRITDNRTGSPAEIGNPTGSITTNDDKREFYRGDVDLYVDLLGSHHFRFGYDHEKLTATQLSQTIDGGYYQYFRITTPDNLPGLPVGTEYVSARTFVNGGSFETVNQAYYLQDDWSLFNDRLTLKLGLRNDRFNNKAADGTSFYKSGDQWGPRIGFTFDVFGDQQTKLYGSFGRYFLPVAANTNIRSAGRELDYTRYNMLDGVNADGSPILGDPISTVPNTSQCPDTGTVNCVVTRPGNVQDPSATIAKGLKPQSEDEYILGFEQRLGSGMKVGAYFTQRRLNHVLEDVAIDQAALQYCHDQGFVDDPNGGTPNQDPNILGCNELYTGFSQYVLVNPGSDATIQLNGLPDGSTPTVDFTADQLGYPEAERLYRSLTFTFDREFDGVWSLSGSYTYAKNVGNYEGGVKSDIGQEDSGATQDFDQPGLTYGSYGYLPNDRRHTFKAYGSYLVSDWFNVGVNAVVQSPKHFGCFGIVPASVDPFANQYGPSAFYCQGQKVQRGSRFKSDWRKEVNLSAAITLPTDFESSFRVSVYNVFNDQSKLDYNEVGELDSGNPDPNYGKPLVYQTPRYVQFQFRVGF